MPPGGSRKDNGKRKILKLQGFPGSVARESIDFKNLLYLQVLAGFTGKRSGGSFANR